MTQRFRSFASEPDIDEILDSIEFRQKSKFIKDAIRRYVADGAAPDPREAPPGKEVAAGEPQSPLDLQPQGRGNPGPSSESSTTSRSSTNSSKPPEPTPTSEPPPEPATPPLQRLAAQRRQP